MEHDYLERSYFSVSRAIYILCNRFDNIALPIRHSVHYDILAEKDFNIYRIKVISTKSKTASGNYIANLRKSGGYSKTNTQKAPFDKKSCDYVYVITPDHEYLIPSHEVKNSRALSMGSWNNYILRDSSAEEQRPVKPLVEGSIPSRADF